MEGTGDLVRALGDAPAQLQGILLGGAMVLLSVLPLIVGLVFWLKISFMKAFRGGAPVSEENPTIARAKLQNGGASQTNFNIVVDHLLRAREDLAKQSHDIASLHSTVASSRADMAQQLAALSKGQYATSARVDDALVQIGATNSKLEDVRKRLDSDDKRFQLLEDGRPSPDDHAETDDAAA